MKKNCLTCGYADGRYVLPPLPYSPVSLAPLLDEDTVLLHHDKHHAAYVAGANAAAGTLRRISAGDLAPEAAPAAAELLAFNLGGHILHCLYWHSISPTPQKGPEGALADAINRSFGSYAGFVSLFRSITLAVQGSGWGVLGVDPMSGLLRIMGACRHQDVLVPGFQPLIACDVWEHAYYLRYRNNRAGYIDTFLDYIDWEKAEKRLTEICNG